MLLMHYINPLGAVREKKKGSSSILFFSKGKLISERWVGYVSFGAVGLSACAAEIKVAKYHMYQRRFSLL